MKTLVTGEAGGDAGELGAADYQQCNGAIVYDN
mgnify:CR=1 FL=1